MEHGKKYLLVPQERLSQFVSDQLSELDRIMHDILKKKNLDTSEKAVLYQQALQKYVKFSFPQQTDNFSENEINAGATKITAEPLEKEIKLEPEPSILSENSSAAQSDDIEQEIVESVPQKSRKTVKEIIEKMREPGSSVFWTPDKELVVNGKILRRTNIVDLINHLVRDRKIKPVGYKNFHEALMKSNLPPTHVKNKYLKKESMIGNVKSLAWDSY